MKIKGSFDVAKTKNIVRFGQKLVPFLLLGQLNQLKIMLKLKNLVFLKSAHFGLSTGTKKLRKSWKM